MKDLFEIFMQNGFRYVEDIVRVIDKEVGKGNKNIIHRYTTASKWLPMNLEVGYKVFMSKYTSCEDRILSTEELSEMYSPEELKCLSDFYRWIFEDVVSMWVYKSRYKSVFSTFEEYSVVCFPVDCELYVKYICWRLDGVISENTSESVKYFLKYFNKDLVFAKRFFKNTELLHEKTKEFFQKKYGVITDQSVKYRNGIGTDVSVLISMGFSKDFAIEIKNRFRSAIYKCKREYDTMIRSINSSKCFYHVVKSSMESYPGVDLVAIWDRGEFWSGRELKGVVEGILSETGSSNFLKRYCTGEVFSGIAAVVFNAKYMNNCVVPDKKIADDFDISCSDVSRYIDSCFNAMYRDIVAVWIQYVFCGCWYRSDMGYVGYRLSGELEFFAYFISDVFDDYDYFSLWNYFRNNTRNFLAVLYRVKSLSARDVDILKDRQSGMKCKDVAKKYNISTSTVGKIVKTFCDKVHDGCCMEFLRYRQMDKC